MAFSGFFFQKMILIEIQYEIYKSELMAIIKVLKTWKYYLESCKHEVLVFIEHNNL